MTVHELVTALRGTPGDKPVSVLLQLDGRTVTLPIARVAPFLNLAELVVDGDASDELHRLLYALGAEYADDYYPDAVHEAALALAREMVAGHPPTKGPPT